MQLASTARHSSVYNPLHLQSTGLGSVKAISIPLPSGDAGIAKTIEWMRKAATQGAKDPAIRALALQITSNVANKDATGEVQAVYDWVKQNIKFRGEWDETVQTPEVTLKFRAGDCDDHSILVCALLGSLGYDCRFSTVAVHGEKDFTHVYAEVQDRSTGQWVPLDTTMAEASPGWEPGGISRKKAWRALGYLARGPAPVNFNSQFSNARTYTPNWMRARGVLRGLGQNEADGTGFDQGSGFDQVSQDIQAAQPLVNAISAVNVQNYQQQQYQREFPYYSPYSSPFSSVPRVPVTTTLSTSNVTPWLIGGGLVLLAVIAFSSNRSREARR